MDTAPTYDLVIRFRLPGLWGRRCRLIDHGNRKIAANGKWQYNSGDNRVSLELDDGSMVTAIRSAVVLATSRPGKQTLARAANGDVALRVARRREGRRR